MRPYYTSGIELTISRCSAVHLAIMIGLVPFEGHVIFHFPFTHDGNWDCIFQHSSMTSLSRFKEEIDVADLWIAKRTSPAQIGNQSAFVMIHSLSGGNMSLPGLATI